MDTAELVERIRDGERYMPDPDDVLGALSIQRNGRRRRRLAVQVGAAAAAVVLIAVAATTVVAHRADTPARPPAVPIAPTGAGPTSSATGAPATSSQPVVTAAELSRYRWSTMPAAPIGERDQAVIGWTGTEMIVWGGVGVDGKGNNTSDLADGAAYNPTTKTWRLLPAAPVDARIPQTSVWTGTEFIIWGGDHGQTDGAAYNPTTNSWRTIPAVPGATVVGGSADFGTGAVAAWTGEVVQLLTWRYQGSAIQSWYYSPSRDTWTLGDPIQPATNALLGDAELLVRGDQVDAFVGWSSRDSAGDITDHVTAYTRTSGDALWRPVGYRPALERVGPVVDAGSTLLIAGGQPFVGFHSSPAWTVPGQRLNPDTGAATDLPQFPGIVDMGDYAIAWTGAALLGYGSDSYVQEADGTIQLPGQAAVWDPATDVWTVLPAAPLAPYGVVPGVWTGTELLSWGLMFPPDQANSTDRQVRAAGLVFGPVG